MPRAASAHFVADALATRVVTAHSGYHLDIEGGLQASQYGMVFVAARLALYAALYVHLARQGKVAMLPADMREIGSQVFDLLAADPAEADVLATAMEFERANPSTPDEVRQFVEAYRAFFANVLQLDRGFAHATLFSDNTYDQYLNYASELTKAFELIGIAGINIPDIRARAAKRTAVAGRLSVGEPNVPSLSIAKPIEETAPDVRQVVVSLDERDVEPLRAALRALTEAITAELASTDGRDERRELLVRQGGFERTLERLAEQARPTLSKP
jgi:hypothetical protein